MLFHSTEKGFHLAFYIKQQPSITTRHGTTQTTKETARYNGAEDGSPLPGRASPTHGTGGGWEWTPRLLRGSLTKELRFPGRQDQSRASCAVAAMRSCATKAGQTTTATLHGQIRAGQATMGEGRGEPERDTKRRGNVLGSHRGTAVGGGEEGS